MDLNQFRSRQSKLETLQDLDLAVSRLEIPDFSKDALKEIRQEIRKLSEKLYGKAKTAGLGDE